MTRARSPDWDAIAAATPNDVVAARVVAQPKEELGNDGYPHWRSRICPRIRTREECEPEQRVAYDTFVGVTYGELTVIGPMAKRPRYLKKLFRNSGEKSGVWVVRCSCGWYESRLGKNIKQTIKRLQKVEGFDRSKAACAECRRRRREEHSLSFPDFFEPAPDSPAPQTDGEGVPIEELAASWAKDEADGV